MTESDWGPWIEHDGRGCPIRKRQNVEVKHQNADGDMEQYEISECTEINHPAWIFKNYGKVIVYNGFEGRCGRVVEYRIRKPKGLAILNSILREVERTPELV